MFLLTTVTCLNGADPKEGLDQGSQIPAKPEIAVDGTKDRKVVKTNAEWRKLLTKQQFRVTRLKDTEPAYSGAYWQSKKDGLYHCVCCGQVLFDSQTKFESGTGWPSFWKPADKEAVRFQLDNSELEVRTEVLCSRCDAHLGHVFHDGPPPTGLRFCTNSASLKHAARAGTADNEAKTVKTTPKKRRP